VEGRERDCIRPRYGVTERTYSVTEGCIYYKEYTELYLRIGTDVEGEASIVV
jgi:hypothetical protein